MIMDFGYALQALREGLKVSRSGWNGRGQWIELQVPDINSKMTLPYIYIKTVQGDFVPWLASQTDMLADDFDIVKEQRAMGGGEICGEEACKEAGEKEASGEEKGEEVAV